MTSQGLPLAVWVRDGQTNLTMQQTLQIELMDQSQLRKLYLELLGFEFREYQHMSSLNIQYFLKCVIDSRKTYRLRPQFLVELALAGTGCTELLEASLATGSTGPYGYNALAFAAMDNGQWETFDRLLELADLSFSPSPIQLRTMVNLSIEDGHLDKVQRLSNYTPVYDERDDYMFWRLKIVPIGRLDILQYLLASYPAEAQARKEEHMVTLARESIRRLRIQFSDADLRRLRFLVHQLENSQLESIKREQAELQQALLEFESMPM